MDRILDAGFKQPRGGERLHPERDRRAGTPAFDAVVQDAAARLSQVAVVQNSARVAPTRKISKDGHAALVDFEISGERDKAPTRSARSSTPSQAAQAAHPGFFIGEMGDASAQKAVRTSTARISARRGCSPSRSRS